MPEVLHGIVWLPHEIVRVFSKPMISSGPTAGLMHTLLDNTPGAGRGEEERVLVDLEIVLYSGGIYFGAHARRVDQFFSIRNTLLLGCLGNFPGSLSTGLAFSSGNLNAQVLPHVFGGFLECPTGHGCDSTTVSVEA